nr:MAG TPA: hypothetical protein [Caudoviricetes sp.]
MRGASADTRTANCRACSTKSACLWCSPPPTTRIKQYQRTVGFHHHTQRGSPMRHPIREEPHG